MPTHTPVITSEIQHVDDAVAATGFGWSYEPNYKVASITGKLQHRRDMTERKATVKQYGNMLKAGSVPPPICVTKDGMLVYGNHRKASADLVGQDSLPAIVIDVNGNGADVHVTSQLLSIAYAENRPHGEKYSPADRQDAAGHLLVLGYTNRAVQSELGLSASQVSAIKREVEAQERFEALGITASVSRPVSRALAGPDARALNDEPWKQLVALTKDADLTTTEVNSYAKDAKAAGSDIQATAVLSNLRNDLAQRIAEHKVGGATRPTPVGKLKGALKNVLSLCDSSINPVTYKDHTSSAPETIQMLEEVISCLQGIREAQEEVAA